MRYLILLAGLLLINCAPATPSVRNTPQPAPIDGGVQTDMFDGVEMVRVPAGCVRVDDGAERCFDQGFWLDRFEVSQAQFERLNGVHSGESAYQGMDLPVENITIEAAQAFCQMRGGELPTDTEWEYAARGPAGSIYPWGDEWEPALVNSANDADPFEFTAPVNAFPEGSSWVGAYQMAGNVWEWVLAEHDFYNDSLDGLILRGGSWFTEDESGFRVGYRFPGDVGEPPYTGFDVGFRCVRYLNER